MPGWITHLGIGWLILEALKNKEHRLQFLVGRVLPDVEKIYVVIGFMTSPRLEDLVQAFFEPTHTILGALLLSNISTFIFRSRGDSYFVRDVGWIFAGAFLHIVLDSFILSETSNGVKLLWPLTSFGFGIRMVPLGDWRPAAIISTICLVIALMRRRGRRIEDNDGGSKPNESS
ncbi:MAG: metal-dependent hydrolase [Thermoproteota archaeon]